MLLYVLTSNIPEFTITSKFPFTFWKISWGLTHTQTSFVNGDGLQFISSSCSITLTTTSSAMLNKSSRSLHSCLALHIREEGTHSFPVTHGVGCMFVQMFLVNVTQSSSISICQQFLRWLVLNWCFFCINFLVSFWAPTGVAFNVRISVYKGRKMNTLNKSYLET